jgi:2-amino-4-hydroxy-6-hydroxymethyldihydropteridine diphosphokinase
VLKSLENDQITMAKVFIGVGSNIKPEENILKALLLLKKEVKVNDSSTFYRTPPLKHRDQPQYVNGVFLIETMFKPRTLKYNVLRKIEEICGRLRTEDAYDSRTIDLDILLYENIVLEEPDITIPDPGISIRPFIGIPLLELAPRLVLPDSGKPLKTIVTSMNREDMIPADDITEKIKKGLKE